jgi:DNA-binding NtrC family response regulator
VVLTGHPDVTTAIEAMKLGAYDYLTKPFKLAEVEIVLRRAAERRRLTQENTALRRMVAQRGQPPLVLGESGAMASVLATVERIAAADANVLIEGESGTGKGLIAQTIHQRSPRSQGPFLAINCSGFQDQLLESELFGHEKGAFTGAVGLKQGLFEVAERGTLFLDEVAEMSPAMQAKLLQVLDSREFRRVGGTRLHRADVRVVAATNKSMQGEVDSGRFREDLYYRLNVVNILVPPLRERREDIPILVEYFLTRFQASEGVRKTLSPDALQSLVEYPWPGNVRELSNIIERLVILTQGEVIGSDALPANIRSPRASAREAQSGALSLAEMERLHIARVLRDTGWKKMLAARLLAIDLKTLNKKIRDYRIEVPAPH